MDADVPSGEPLALLVRRRVGHRDEGAESHRRVRDTEGVGAQRGLPVSFDLLASTTSTERDTVASPSMALVAEPQAAVAHDHHDGGPRG